MLSDAQVERYARQIVLPEVGGRGQARLLASRAHVLGDGPASRHAADLLRRAGVQVSDAEPSVVIDLRVDGSFPTAADAVPTVVGRLRETCAVVDSLPAGIASPREGSANDGESPDPSLHACALRALGALAASEALILLLEARRGARRTTIDLSSGRFSSVGMESLA